MTVSQTLLDKAFGPFIGKDGNAGVVVYLGYVENAGTPVSALVPTHIGQICFDTTNLDFYIANALTNADWAPMAFPDLSATELNILDGATVTTAELNILDGVTATAAEINRAADTSSRVVTLTGDTSVTEALHDGKVILLGEVGGDASLTATLPAATGSGAVFKFIVSVVNTSNYVIQAANANDTMDGSIVSLADAGDTTVGWETAAASDTITLNGTTTGGVNIGDEIELIDIATNQWAVKGRTVSSGAEATPFSAAV